MKWSEVKSLSRVWLSATPWTAASQAPPSMGFSRQEYWSGLPFPSPEDLPASGIEPGSPILQADALPSKPPGKLREMKENYKFIIGANILKMKKNITLKILSENVFQKSSL